MNDDWKMAVLGFYYVGVLCLVHTWASGRGCEFPPLLHDSDGGAAWWLYRVTYAGAQLKNNTIVYVEVYGSQISTTSLGGSGVSGASYSYERQCLSEFENQTYLVAHFQGDSVRHMCVQFVTRSSHVVQLAVSESVNVSQSLNCSEETLALDPWPLIRFDDRANGSFPCPVHGGYDVELYDRYSSALCTDKYFIARYECGCTDSNLIHLDLRACRIGPNLVGMESQQEVMNIASWEEGNYRFTILKRPRVGLYWSLRLPRIQSPRMVGYLSSDVICSGDQEVNSMDNALMLHLTERIVASVCADASPYCSADKCNEPSLFSELYCESTCGHCEDTKKTTCQFPPSSQGTWKSVTDEHPDFTITSYQYIVNGEVQPCVFHNAATKTYQLLKFDTSGCSPQYTCMTLKPIGPSVMRYNLFPGPAWDPLFTPGVCYTSRKYNLISEESRFSLAVMSNGDGRVPCDLPGSAYSILSVSQDGSACHGRFYKPDCKGNDGAELVLNYTRCLESEAMPAQRFACLAQLPVFAPRRLVLIRDIDSGDLFCLSFATAISNFEILPGEKCRGSFTKNDVINTIHVTQELSGCSSSSDVNNTESRYVNFSRPVVHGSFSYVTTVNPDLIKRIKTVTPVMSPDRNNFVGGQYQWSRNYYRNSARGDVGREYNSEGRVDCNDKSNSDVSRCRQTSDDALADSNRTKRKMKPGTKVIPTTTDPDQRSTTPPSPNYEALVGSSSSGCSPTRSWFMLACMMILYLGILR